MPKHAFDQFRSKEALLAASVRILKSTINGSSKNFSFTQNGLDGWLKEISGSGKI